MKRLAETTRWLLWGGGVCLLFAACGNDYLFVGMEEPKPPPAVDVLFLLDNSASMVDEQQRLAESLPMFLWVLEEQFAVADFRMAVTTTEVAAPECPGGEGGDLLDRLGRVVRTDPPEYEFVEDPRCRVVTRDNLDCLYDPGTGRGTLLVGHQGCGIRRGFSAMRRALEQERGFLRPEASLVVVLVSDGEDCGEPGEVQGTGPGPEICYQAAAGADPKLLSPVQDSYRFLMGLKDHQEGLVKFAALTGVEDQNDPLSTGIGFVDGEVQSACVTPGCRGPYCRAGPGTRAIRLADRFGLGHNGLVETICRPSYTESMWTLGEFSACPTVFFLDRPIANPGQADIRVNGDPIPRYSCARTGELRQCLGPGDRSCGPDGCVKTWIYRESAGTITFSGHYNPCRHFDGPLRLQVVDPVP